MGGRKGLDEDCGVCCVMVNSPPTNVLQGSKRNQSEAATSGRDKHIKLPGPCFGTVDCRPEKKTKKLHLDGGRDAKRMATMKDGRKRLIRTSGLTTHHCLEKRQTVVEREKKMNT